MDETGQRRLLGAFIVFLVLFALASWLPNRNPGPGDTGAEAELEAVPDSSPKVVVYDLNAPERNPVREAGSADVPVPAPPKPVAPVLTLEPSAGPAGNSLGWYVQLGSYASKASAQGTLTQMSQAGFSGSIQEILKDKKTLYRSRIGPFASNAEAQQAQQAAVAQGFADARLVEVWKP